MKSRIVESEVEKKAKEVFQARLEEARASGMKIGLGAMTAVILQVIHSNKSDKEKLLEIEDYVTVDIFKGRKIKKESEDK